MATTQSPLFFHEEIMLLALRDEEGTVKLGADYGHALGAAVLADLLLAGRISVDEGRRRLVNLISDEPVGEPIIDECLEKIAAAKRRASIQTWLQRFASLKNLHHRVAQGLCRRGILYADERTILLIFRRKVYPELSPEPERKVIERLRRAIFTDVPRIDPRTAILVSLANSGGLLRAHFNVKELRRRKKRIAQLTNGELIGKATKEAIEAAQAAVMIACVIPAVIATTAATH